MNDRATAAAPPILTASRTEDTVLERYGAASKAVEAALCCPTSYDPRWLEAIPDEVLEVDYGCGDPSRWAHEGDVVVDLGSGSGKIAFILSQVVGAEGRIIGVDLNDDMLALARRSAPVVAERVGWANIEFRKGRIQDLELDLAGLERWLAERPVSDIDSLRAMEAEVERLRAAVPLVATDSVDLVVSNCVLNLVPGPEKPALFREIHRVLRRGGRAVISDIVSDESVPEHLQADPELWSGCISGAFREDLFLAAFEDAGFYGVEIVERQAEPWRVVEGIEFRSLTVRAYVGKGGPCLERKQAVVYRGPWKAVIDDDGHTLHRGQRMAVCDKTFHLYLDPHGPYADHLEPVEPLEPTPLDEAPHFDCSRDHVRHPRETKGQDYDATFTGDPADCGPECC